MLTPLVRLVAVSLLVALPLAAQSIFTWAGGGSVDGQLATDITVSSPRGIAIEADGDVLFTERRGGRVRRVDINTRRVTTIVGTGGSGFSGDGGPATSATLNEARGIVLDSQGNLFIADFGNNRVRRVDARTGVITTFAGGAEGPAIGDGGVATQARLSGPWGLTIDRGFLYITEMGFDGNRVRRVNLSTNVIETIAGATDGSAGFSGDGGPALAAKLDTPAGVVADADGNLFVSDLQNGRVRRIDAATKVITTYAGGGSPADGVGDGLVATEAAIEGPAGLAFDAAGNLLVASTGGRLRRIDKTTRVITTIAPITYLPLFVAVSRTGQIFLAADESRIFIVEPDNTLTRFAGGGSFIGDGREATSAVLHEPHGLALDSNFNLYIADITANVIRRVSADGTITTVAGQVGESFAPPEQEGANATEARIGFPIDVALDSQENLYISDVNNEKIWRVDKAGKLTTYVGGGSEPIGDGKLASAISVVATGIAFDAQDNLYLTGRSFAAGEYRVWRVDRQTKVVRLIAGTGEEGFSGDGGPATAAKFRSLGGLAVDSSGTIYVADQVNGRIRKIDTQGMITTFAGTGDSNTPKGDGGPAVNARIDPHRIAIHKPTGDVYFTDGDGHRVRKIDVRTNIITTVAGSADFYFFGDFSGDNGRATDAKMNFGFNTAGIAVSAAGDVFVADTNNNRVRVVFACIDVATPQLLEPANNTANTTTGPTLRWTPAAGAFRYDIFLDTTNPPARLTATDVEETSFTLSNLEPGRTYFWRVVGKSDPFCPPKSSSSAVRSFTTSGTCSVGTFQMTSPANGATNVVSPVTLTWGEAAGAASYDVYFGSTEPPALVASGLTARSFTIAAPLGGQHYAMVVAHAACDPSRTSSTSVTAFRVATPATCSGPTALTALTPADGASNVAVTTELTWRADGCATAPFQVFFGTNPNPPLFAAEISATRQLVTGLEPGTTYYWRIQGVNTQNGQPIVTAVQSFTTRACATPGATSIVFAPASVSAGTTYTIVWSPASDLDAEGGYLVERSTTADFSSGLTSQVVSSTAASFVAEVSGSYFHRVRAVAGCDPSRNGASSAPVRVAVTTARPNVVFTVQPEAVVTNLNERLEDHRRTFTLENLGTEPTQVIVGRQELGGSTPFFSIIDPQGSDVAFVTLEPRRPRTFEIRFSGPPNNVAATYQGIIFIASTGQGLAVTPYAFVNLKIGGGVGATPQFIVNGVPTEYVAFPGHSGDDTNRPPISIGIRNPGTTDMSLAAEIGPEVWLVPETGWNATPLPAGATRTVNLSTRRSRAPNGSALPRYTYFTVRTRDGQSARLLVQDNEAPAVSAGRTTRLESTTRSFIVSDVVSRIGSQSRRVATRLRLSNVGSDAVQTELIFTPTGADGFDATQVKRAVVLVPANDVVSLTDPLAQVFGVAAPANGQVEVRIPRERLGLLFVNASTVVLDGPGTLATPVVNRGEGARLGEPHVVYGVAKTAIVRTALVLAETTGTDGATVRLDTFDASGGAAGSQTVTLRRYGHLKMEDIAAPENGRVEIHVTSGGGTVIGVALITDATGETGATTASRPVNPSIAGAALARAFWKGAAAITSVTTVVPVVPAPTSAGATPALRTSLALVAPPTVAANFTATFRDAGGSTANRVTVSVPSGGSRIYGDVVRELFGAPASASGSVFVEGPPGAKVWAVLQSGSGSQSAPNAFLPLPTTLSESLSSATSAAQRPLFLDGLEQSIDPSRGSRWLVVLNELGGANGIVNVKLYEAGNRSRPIAERDMLIAPYQQLTLDTVFAAAGLDSAERRKDRTNVQVVVTAAGGAARVAASAMSIDNRTGQTQMYALAPSVGSATPSVTLVQPTAPPTTPVTPTRRRTVKP